VTHASEARADQTAETTVERNAAAKAEATPEAGKLVQATSRKNEFDKFDNQKTVITPTPLVETFTVPSSDGDILVRVFANQASIPLTDIPASNNNSPSVSFTPFSGLYNGSIISRPDTTSAGGSSSDWDAGFGVDIPECLKYGEVSTTKAYFLFTSSRIKAQAFLTHFAGDLVDSGAGGSTGVRYLGRGRYKITAVIDGASSKVPPA
jgi:hypothetical protein